MFILLEILELYIESWQKDCVPTFFALQRYKKIRTIPKISRTFLEYERKKRGTIRVEN